MAHDPGEHTVLKGVNQPVEYEFVQDDQDDDEEKQVTEECLMSEVKQDAEADSDPESPAF
jgi:hypothetical protein